MPQDAAIRGDNMRRILLCFIGLVISYNLTAEEHPACHDIDFPYQEFTSETLRAIADTCTVDAIADLYYGRARHMDLMADHEIMSKLGHIREEQDDWTMDQESLFLALVEVFTAQQNLPEIQRAEVINIALDRTIEIAELRLRGYDRQARRLEMEGIQPPSKGNR